MVLLNSVTWSQVNGLIHEKIQLDSCIVQLGDEIIDPSTVVISPSIQYQVRGNYIYLPCENSEEWRGLTIDITYRVLSIDLREKMFFLDTTQMVQREEAVYIGYDYNPYEGERIDPLFGSSSLNYSGSLSRGFSVGNSQSLVLNSNLNLQLNGDLGNGIKVVAAISDDNIPIQAEGNTQILQEFDKVFIKVSKDKTDIIAGDYDLNSDYAHFINYYKKLQGLRLDNQINTSDNATVSTSASFAISRGKFARQILEVREGNQGPYKLVGNNGERFLIVLQGSEKVYFDGVLLLRGLDYDYVIDYNNAEITFTPRKLVTREARIIVEYEYTDQNYLRSLYAVNSEYRTDQYGFHLNFYNEQDSKNATGQIDLDSTDITVLTGSDGTPGSLLRPGVRSLNDLEVTDNTIFYLPTLNPATGDSILVYSKERVDGVVTAVFSELGQGRGDYIIDSEAGANGRVYKYVGEGEGIYLPVVQLIAPEKRQMMSLGGDINLSKATLVSGEVSLSNFDGNRFSEFDNARNQGVAYQINLEHNSKLTPTSRKPVFILNYEHLDDNFQILNPYRNAEFNRDWNISTLPRTAENLANALFKIGNGNNLEVGYRFSFYDRKGQYTGFKHLPSLTMRDSSYSLLITNDYLTSDGSIESTRFNRPLIEMSKTFAGLKNWSLRMKYLAESNQRRNVVDDALLASSYSWDEYYVYVDSPQEMRSRFSFYGKRRIDRLPRNNELIKAATINEAGINGTYRGTNSGLLWNLSYRDFKVEEAELLNETNTSTLLGRVDYDLRAWNGFLTWTSSFNLGSGQEAKREFQFVKVERGEGNYIYLGDLNEDGEDQINEYEIAVFSDQADFIRVNVVNNEFIRTENQGINQSLRLSPDKILRDRSSGVSKLLSKITTSSIIRIDQKISTESGGGISFLDFNIRDTSLVSYNSLTNHTLFFNRGNPTYDLQLGYRSTNNRFVQITGYEDRRLSEYFFRSRFNPKSYFDIITNVEIGKRENDSEFFDNKDLDLNQLRIEPSINYRPSSKLRIKLQYSYETKDQQINDLEQARFHELTAEATWRQAARSSLVASISLVDISYEGLLNTPIAYSILNGLNRGNNYLWSLDLTRRLAGNVDLSINYNGRKTGDAPTVHVMRAQVRANF